MTSPATPEALLAERFVLSDQAPNNDVYGPERRYGVWDHWRDTWAQLPNATLCWGLEHNGALDCLNELRELRRAPRTGDNDLAGEDSGG